MYAIAPTPVIQNVDPLAARRTIARLLTRIISRAYGSIDQILNIDIADDGLITCLFRDDDKDRKLIRLALGDRAEYKQVLDGRTDAVNTDADQYLVAYANSIGQRTDKISKPKNCKTGLSCKGACISKNDTCRIDVPEALNRQEISDLNDAVNQVQQAKFVGVAPDEDELNNKNIRELKDEARKRGVYRYSYMTQNQLRESIRLQKANPDRQRVVQEGLNRTASSKKALKSLLPQPVAGAWRDIEKISKFFGDNRPAAGILAASVLLGIPSSVMMSARDNYKEGLPESATMAYQRSLTTPVESTSKPQITFAVGGFSNLGSSGDKLAEYLKTPLDTSRREQWFNKTQEIIPFNNTEFNVPPTNIEQKDKNGNYNPLYLGYVAKESFGKYLSNVVGGRNEAAVDLASKLYAYGSKYRDKPLNVVSHGSGGNVVDEAAEILSRIKPAKGLDGGEILKRLNIARLGGASFGLTGGTTQDDKNWANINNRTITSKNDPFSILPKKFAQFVSSVKGHEIGDYLSDGNVRDKIRETFGFFSNSVAGSKSSDKSKKEVFEATGTLLKAINPALGKIWSLTEAIGQKYKDNPTAAAISTAAVLAQTTVGVAVAARANYNNNIQRSALEAQGIVASGGTSSPAPTKPQVIVAIGDGETPSGNVAKSITDNSKKVKDQTDRDMYDQSDVIAFDRTLPPQPKGRVMGIIDTMAKSYEAVMSKSLKVGRDPEAVRLAAELYQIGNSTYGSNTTEHPAIAIVGLKQGGETAKRALDILESMQKVGSQGNVSGSYIAKQIHLVTLGTPELGFGGDKADFKKPDGDILKTPKTDLWSDGDLWSRTPFKGKNPDNFSGSNGSWVDYLSVDAADMIAKKLNATLTQRRKARKQTP
jgi:hypothetical protein